MSGVKRAVLVLFCGVLGMLSACGPEREEALGAEVERTGIEPFREKTTIDGW